MSLTHGSLFTGEGGFDLASEWMGWDNVFHCEWNENLKWFLKRRWKGAESYGDIAQTDFTIWRGRVDVLTGGFPCQPYSQSGKRLGKEDDRHLWPEMLRAVREAQPTWIVGENVRGLVNWNGGLVFEEVQADLEAEGYEVQPFLLPAAGIGAPHERYRIWFVAYSKNKRGSSGTRQNINTNGGWKLSEHKPHNGNKIWDGFEPNGTPQFTSDTNGFGLRNEINWHGKTEQSYKNGTGDFWEDFPTQPPICSGDDGLSPESLRQFIREDSDGYLSEKEIDKIFSKANTAWRKEVLMAGGNAVVPQVPLQIFKAIEQYENLKK